jgi:hypothetical protein
MMFPRSAWRPRYACFARRSPISLAKFSYSSNSHAVWKANNSENEGRSNHLNHTSKDQKQTTDMKTFRKKLLGSLTISALALWIGTQVAHSQGTTFTYQGRLADAGGPVSGNYDLRFTVWDSAVGGLQVGAPIVVAPVLVSGGLFSVPLNFGATVFTGPPRWLQIESRVFGGGSYSLITPRQPLTAAPYAITAGNLTGMLPAGQLTGTIPDPSLSPNVALLNRNPQTFTGQNSFTSPVGIGTTTPGHPLHVNGDARVDGALFLNRDDVALYQGSTARFGGAAGWRPNPFGQGVFLESGINESGGFYADGDVAVIWSPGDPDLLRVYDEDDLPGGSPKFVIDGVGNVNITGNVNFTGQLNKLDVADNFTAIVRAADFTLGHSSRRGSPGRALVDFGNALIVNFAADWPDTVVNGNLTADGSQLFMGRSKTGKFFGAANFDFNSSNPATDGLLIEQGYTHSAGLNESAGIYLDADSISMWSPGDGGRLLRLYDEDGMIERFYIDGGGNVFGTSFTSTSSRRFKENIAPIGNALDKVMHLQGVTFDWTKDKGHKHSMAGKHSIGFIAEDFANVLPELVAWENNGKDAVGLDYDKITAVTVEAIKELKAQKDQEIEALKKKNAEMESRLAELEAKDKARELRFSVLEKLAQQATGHIQEASLKSGAVQ